MTSEMPKYQSPENFQHGSASSLGILIVNLGTPDEPTPKAVRRYLAEFLWDARVVELPRLLWWLILHGVILRVRPSKSAHAYQAIWSGDGSPLLVYSRKLAEALQARFADGTGDPVVVELGMSYGSPSIEAALQKLYRQNADRILVLPLYPQYSGTTTGSVFDAVTAALSRRRWVPEFRFINHYHDREGYIDALASSIREHWQENGEAELLLFSFHGLPERNLYEGDPYHCQCHNTARRVASKLGLDETQWRLSFQSRVGAQKWLQPYTDETVQELGGSGLQRLDVICPGFAVDCLETLEEIAMQNAEIFREAGGSELCYIPALNLRDDHVDCLTELIREHAAGWLVGGASAEEREETARRAKRMGADR